MILIAVLVPGNDTVRDPHNNSARVVYMDPYGNLHVYTVRDLSKFLQVICPALSARHIQRIRERLYNGVRLHFPPKADIPNPCGVRLVDVLQATERMQTKSPNKADVTEQIRRAKEVIARLERKKMSLAWVRGIAYDTSPISDDVDMEQEFARAGGQPHHAMEQIQAILQALADLRRCDTQLEEAKRRLAEIEG